MKDEYHIGDSSSSGNICGVSNGEIATPLALPVARQPLVNNSISHPTKNNRNPVKELHVYPSTLQMVREFRSSGPKNAKYNQRKEITSFSKKSQSRLKQTANDAFPVLISQFCATWHKYYPTGKESKKMLNLFLNQVRKKYQDIKYLWILEFQTREYPHFHIYFSYPYDTVGMHDFLAETWHRIAEPNDEEHLEWHKYKGQTGWETDRRKKRPNFMPWDMNGAYLTKYLSKEYQKVVPNGYSNVGRFWGASRGLGKQHIEIENDYSRYDLETVDEQTGEVFSFNATNFVIRQLCKHHEAMVRKYGKKSRARTTATSYRLSRGARIFWQLENWLEKQYSGERVFGFRAFMSKANAQSGA